MKRRSRTLTRIVTLALLVAVFTGCESVNVRHIIGERHDADLSGRIDGAWRVDDAVLFIHQVEPGELRAGFVEWDDGAKRFEVTEVPIIVSRLGLQDFFNLPKPAEAETEEAGGEWYNFLLFTVEGERLTIRGPSVDFFEQAVDDGALIGRVQIERGDAAHPARITQRHVWVEAEKAELDAFIRSRSTEDLFAEPATLERIGEGN